MQLLWEGGGAKARADVFRRDLSSKINMGGPSELWFVKDGLPSSQAGVGNPLLEFSKGCSGGIWWFSFLMSVESFLVVVWSFFFFWGGGGRNWEPAQKVTFQSMHFRSLSFGQLRFCWSLFVRNPF